jgi:hypothetical protein
MQGNSSSIRRGLGFRMLGLRFSAILSQHLLWSASQQNKPLHRNNAWFESFSESHAIRPAAVGAKLQPAIQELTEGLL